MAGIKIPSASKSISASMNSLYVLTQEQLQDVSSAINDTSFSVSKLFSEPVEYITSVKVFPFDILRIAGSNYFTNSHLKLGNVDLSTIKSSLANIKKETIGGNGKWVVTDYAKVQILPQYNSFLDYAPYTLMQLYIPYIDTITIDNNTYLNYWLRVHLVIDIVTGQVTAFIGRSVTETGQFECIESYEGKIGFEVPLGITNANEIMRNNLLNLMGIGKNTLTDLSGYTYKAGLKMASANLVGSTAIQTGASAIGTIQQAIETNQVHFKKSISGSGFNSMYSPQECYLIVNKPNPQYPTDYNSTIGRPSGESKLLSDLTGYTKVLDLHLTSLGNATSREIEEVETLLKEGVIL